MVNQRIVIEIASVIYAVATYLVLKCNLTKMSIEVTSKMPEATENEESKVLDADEALSDSSDIEVFSDSSDSEVSMSDLFE